MNLLAPEKPSENALSGNAQVMSDHFQPKPTIIVQHFNFHSHIHKQGETIANFMAEFKKKYQRAENSDSRSISEYTLFNVGDKSTDPIIVTAQVNGAEVSMEVDTVQPGP